MREHVDRAELGAPDAAQGTAEQAVTALTLFDCTACESLITSARRDAWSEPQRRNGCWTSTLRSAGATSADARRILGLDFLARACRSILASK